MHLWFAKKNRKTRPEMLKQEGKYKGQPIGVIPLEVIEQANIICLNSFYLLSYAVRNN